MMIFKSILTIAVLLIFIIGLLGIFAFLEYGKDEAPVWEPGQMSPNEAQVMFPEGCTAKQIEDKLIANGFEIHRGDIVNQNVEGYLFPDTYRFYKDIKPDELVKKMISNFYKKVGNVSKSDLILASIVEKEAGSMPYEDMTKVAGIFKKRLQNHKALESDATVNYITGKRARQPSTADTKIISDYNTYNHIGLPPSPICNPGLMAIRAVQNAKITDYWYFLNPDNKKIIYSKTFQQHINAKLRFLDSKPKIKYTKNNMRIGMIIAAKDFKDEEYFIPKDVFLEQGWTIYTISDKFGPAISVNGAEAKIDVLLKNVNIQDYDALVFVGGSGAVAYFDNEQAQKLAQDAISSEKIIGAICIAPVILAKAGVLTQKHATVWSSAMDKSPIKILKNNGAEYEDKSVVVDGNIVTANGTNASREFANTIVTLLKKY